jgi:KNOX2 domain
MLVKYREELTRPIQEATEFLKRVESQLNSLTNGTALLLSTGNFRHYIWLIGYSLIQRIWNSVNFQSSGFALKNK